MDAHADAVRIIMRMGTMMGMMIILWMRNDDGDADAHAYQDDD